MTEVRKPQTVGRRMANLVTTYPYKVGSALAGSNMVLAAVAERALDEGRIGPLTIAAGAAGVIVGVGEQIGFYALGRGRILGSEVADLRVEKDRLQKELDKTKLLGKYKILGSLGSGGQGGIFLAEQVNLSGKRVAIKVAIFPSANDSQGFDEKEIEKIINALKRAVDEGQTINKIKSRYVVGVLDVGKIGFEEYLKMYPAAGLHIPDIDVSLMEKVLEKAGGVPYLILEAIDGKTISDIIKKEKGFTRLQALKIFLNILKAIRDMQKAKVTHRDLKGDNVMVVMDEEDRLQINEGIIKVIDFATSKVESTTRKTMFGDVIGTPGYMPPEQRGTDIVEAMKKKYGLKDEDLINPNWKNDLYSAGAILWEMTFRTPLDIGQDSTVCLNWSVPPMEDKQLQDILRNTLAPNPYDRYKGKKIEDVIRIVEGIIEGTVVEGTVVEATVVNYNEPSLLSHSSAPTRPLPPPLRRGK